MTAQSLPTACEWAAYGVRRPVIDPWPELPGAATVSSDGRWQVLHPAPGRWLLPAPDPVLLDALRASDAGAVFDVGGKWWQLDWASAPDAVAATIDLPPLLAGRDCAAVTLFDSPCIVARRTGLFTVWVPASYARWLRESLAL